MDVSVTVKQKEVTDYCFKETYNHLCIFSGLDSNGANQTFAITVLSDASVESLAWALNEFLSHNQEPETLISDYRESTLSSAITATITKSNHMFCQRSIKLYLRETLSSLCSLNKASIFSAA